MRFSISGMVVGRPDIERSLGEIGCLECRLALRQMPHSRGNRMRCGDLLRRPQMGARGDQGIAFPDPQPLRQFEHHDLSTLCDRGTILRCLSVCDRHQC